jgi:hypothetical protein
MRKVTLISLFAILVISATAQDKKTTLKAELKEINKRVFFSISNKVRADRSPENDRETSSESKLAKFSGCTLGFSGTIKNHRENDHYEWTASIPLKYVDSSLSSIRRDRGGLWIDLRTLGAKIRRSGLSSGLSPITRSERQTSTRSVGPRLMIWLKTDGDPVVVATDLLRAIEICKVL